MSNVAISVEGLGKRYTIGAGSAEPYGNIRESLMRAAGAPLRRLRNLGGANTSTKDVWALKDVSFEVKHGEAVGIIGRNGAGKSTLLKILSRITEPSAGRAVVDGRVGSLLEVGTGFHPELTGRENIYLNGAVMGMSRADITRRFDEIVDFSGVEQYLDTPVKRYSSGMYMRLAFAVAAHLEPEVLVVDEVLAVGDAEFQKKCLGKMGEVSRQGRTVLFVSHNMGSVQQICTQGVMLSHSLLHATGDIKSVVECYLASSRVNLDEQVAHHGNGKALFENYYLTDVSNEPRFDYFMGDTIRVHFDIRLVENVRPLIIGIEVSNQLGEQFAHITNSDANFEASGSVGDTLSVEVDVNRVFFAPSIYSISLWVGEDYHSPCDYLRDCLEITLLQGAALKMQRPFPSHVKTYVESTWSSAD